MRICSAFLEDAFLFQYFPKAKASWEGNLQRIHFYLDESCPVEIVSHKCNLKFSSSNEMGEIKNMFNLTQYFQNIIISTCNQ